ncbi:hypothetical protein [Natronorubrum tibetense]|uniref:Uncharacterized protein n=1 Tax=Natronorubrum tibetense GA33 TaxID=1114856 RepID=L9WBS9_9EURY|nr:hypothetical protein [Natronorubrum tibetense]ELY45768.1 hypothetical protein C496_02462 [Natronorubrum tibetense GA33]
MVTLFTPTDRSADDRDGGPPPSSGDLAGDNLEACGDLETRPTPAGREPATAAITPLETEWAVSRGYPWH